MGVTSLQWGNGRHFREPGKSCSLTYPRTEQAALRRHSLNTEVLLQKGGTPLPGSPGIYSPWSHHKQNFPISPSSPFPKCPASNSGSPFSARPSLACSLPLLLWLEVGWPWSGTSAQGEAQRLRIQPWRESWWTPPTPAQPWVGVPKSWSPGESGCGQGWVLSWVTSSVLPGNTRAAQRASHNLKLERTRWWEVKFLEAQTESEVVQAWRKSPVVQKGWRELEPGKPTSPWNGCSALLAQTALHACMSGPQEEEVKLNTRQ